MLCGPSICLEGPEGGAKDLMSQYRPGRGISALCDITSVDFYFFKPAKGKKGWTFLLSEDLNDTYSLSYITPVSSRCMMGRISPTHGVFTCLRQFPKCISAPPPLFFLFFLLCENRVLV